MAASQNPPVCDWQRDKSLSECLDLLLMSGVESDVMFIVGDNQDIIRAHRLLLISRSSVFYQMLADGTNTTWEITVLNTTNDIFTKFLRYLYTDSIVITTDCASEILVLAKQYRVDQLASKCERFLQDHHLSMVNAYNLHIQQNSSDVNPVDHQVVRVNYVDMNCSGEDKVGINITMQDSAGSRVSQDLGGNTAAEKLDKSRVDVVDYTDEKKDGSITIVLAPAAAEVENTKDLNLIMQELMTTTECKDKVKAIEEISRLAPVYSMPSSLENETPPNDNVNVDNVMSTQKVIRIVDENTKYSCMSCDMVFNLEKKFKAHLKIKHGEKLFFCDVCGKKFRRSQDLKVHVRVHTGEKPYLCFECNKRFTDRRGLQRHRLIHTGDKPYKCDICGKAFNQLDTLRKHSMIHTGEKPHACDQCGRGFRVSADLKIHLQAHKEKPYECDTCDRCFDDVDMLNIHKKIHIGKKIQKCDQCDKVFMNSVGLRVHRVIHSGDRKQKHKCDKCSKGFFKVSHLQDHMLVHSGDKPHMCSVCGKFFRHGGTLHRHVKIHNKHKTEPDDK